MTSVEIVGYILLGGSLIAFLAGMRFMIGSILMNAIKEDKDKGEV